MFSWSRANQHFIQWERSRYEILSGAVLRGIRRVSEQPGILGVAPALDTLKGLSKTTAR